MKKKPSTLKPLLSAAERMEAESSKLAQARRHLLADWCKLVDARLKGKSLAAPKAADPLEGIHLSPRMNEILQHLLKGDSEKQIASKLKISPHTVHTYVKRLHQTLGVTSRGELLAKFVK